MENPGDDSIYVYLEFSEKLTPSVFANKMFLRIANLHEPNPLVQINDLLFKGTYDESIGTNLFFEEVADPPLKANIFEENTAIRLRPFASQSKLVRLKQMKLPRQSPFAPLKETVSLNLDQDLDTVLEKLEQGCLNLEDLAHKEPEPIQEEQFDGTTFRIREPTTEPETEIDSVLEGNMSAAGQLEAKYEKLKRLARRPVKRTKSPELVEECDPLFREAYEYHNLERQICRTGDAFRSSAWPIIDGSFVGGVDIDRCVLQGTLPSTTASGCELSKEEQRKVFAIDNFQNLSLPARYLVLKECVSQIEELIENTSSEELKEKDDNGRTITDICDIFRRLVRSLEHAISQDANQDDVKVNLSSSFSDDDYVKYKPSGDLVVDADDLFNEEEWMEEQSEEQEEEEEEKEQSDESMDEESDENDQIQ